MVYEYNSRIHLAEVALNVRDLSGQTAFITNYLVWKFWINRKIKFF